MPDHALVVITPVLVALSAGPAISGDPEAGRALYEDFCSVCHGPTAEDGTSGNIRGLPENTVRNALRGTEEMPDFDFLVETEIAAIVAYLAALADR